MEKWPQVLILRWWYFGHKPWGWGLEAWLSIPVWSLPCPGPTAPPVVTWAGHTLRPLTAPPLQVLRVGSRVQWPVLKCQQGQEGKGPLLPRALISHLSDGADDSSGCLHRTYT